MRNKPFLPVNGPFASFRAIGMGLLCAAFLFPPMAAASTLQEQPTEPLPRKVPGYAATAGPIAERVQKKASFAASIAPSLGPVLPLYDKASKTPGRAAAVITDCLWLLHGEPELMAARRDALLTVTTGKEARAAYRNLIAFSDATRQLAMKLRDKDTAARLAERRSKLRKAGDMDAKGAHALDLGLEERMAFDRALSPALNLAKHLDTNALKALVADETTLDALRALAAKPAHLRLAAGVLGDPLLTKAQKRSFLAEISASPDAARKKIARLNAAGPVREAYAFAVNTELGGDMIGLPLASIAPEAASSLDRTGTVPLAASAVAEPHKSLSFARRDSLCSKDAAARGALPALPFLRQGERLYTLWPESGTPVFQSGPLADIASVGPHLEELTEETAPAFPALLENTAPATAWNRPYFIAASCGPEELAAHLGSLAVTRSAREKSLYGPFADYLRRPEKGSVKAYPKDVMGETLRIMNIHDPDLFFVLAPLADEQGLPRLMGPIRGVWTKSAPTGEAAWLEMRYAPRKDALGKGQTLGASPVPALNKDMVKALVAAKEELLLREWALFGLGDDCRNGDVTAACAEAFPAALEKTRRAFKALGTLGVVSPWDKGAMIYLMERHAKNPQALDRITAIINDTRLSGAQRLRAIDTALAEL